MKLRLAAVTLVLLLACSHEAARSSGTAGAAPAAAPPSPATAVVQPSDLSPEQVRLVQRSLVDRGFAVDPTGTFDDRTQTALMDFQRARGLPATGNLSQPTLDALGLDPRDVMPVRGPRPSEAPPLPGTDNDRPAPDGPTDPSHDAARP